MKRLFDADVQALLARLNAVHMNSHFVYTSGKHGEHYIAKDQLGLDPEITHSLAYELAWRLKEANFHDFNDAVAVVGAPMGAIRLSDQVALWLNRLFDRNVKSIYAEKTETGMMVRPAFHSVLQSGPCILIEDIVNEGTGSRALLEAVKDCDAQPIMLGALCNRGKQDAESLGINVLVPLLTVEMNAYSLAEMPDALKRVPIRTDLGHGANWLADPANEELIREWASL